MQPKPSMRRLTVEPPSFPSRFDDMEDLDKTLEQLQVYAYQLKAGRNATFNSMLRLPVDVIVEIFLQLANLHYPSDGRGTFKGYPYRWLSIMHVCKAWRNTALRIPLLWSYIVWYGIPARVEEFLHRSGDCPLTIVPSQEECPQSFYSPLRYGTSNTLNAAFIAEYAHRLREVRDIYLQTPHSNLSTTSKAMLPILHSLCASRRGVVGSYASTVVASHLAHLTVEHVNLASLPSLRILIGPTLTTLRVWFRDNQGAIPSQEWANALKEAISLEELWIGGSLRFQPDIEMNLAPTCRVILPKLRKLDLAPSTAESFRSCTDFLAHLACPPDVHVKLRSAENPNISREVFQLVSGRVSAFWARDNMRQHPKISSVSWGSSPRQILRFCEIATPSVLQAVDRWWCTPTPETITGAVTYKFYRTDPASSRYPPALSLCFKFGWREAYSLRKQRYLFEFPEFPLFSDLTHLTLDHLSAATSAWHGIAANCRAVTHLRIISPNLGEIENLITVLVSGHRQSPETIYLPQLEVLGIWTKKLGVNPLPRPDTRDPLEKAGRPIPKRLANALCFRKRRGLGPTVLQINGRDQSIPMEDNN
ncbi:hypothetical protein PHLGIDRAFT_470858 [Phlebiopsis gigantea 11061_1 CR5-6]|uniref:Uncharacterized protein n=1 Tax=Phlebiopsis gigantea (strain 11061_1 CR5-6) TaxID=745531 RepID=A0A0C3PJ61_PHLG1|nr:hypothetical protein PHLGIDRAFT_470858 [Phlebiopsis gigantea 11061_1 CR5-6]